MEDGVRTRLIKYAESIDNFRNLHPEEQDWLFPLLSKGFRSTIELLNLISHEAMTFEEIASALGINKQTVSQKLNALVLGGLLIQLTDTSAFAPTGRPRKLARR